jgi:hypothetical protein
MAGSYGAAAPSEDAGNCTFLVTDNYPALLFYDRLGRKGGGSFSVTILALLSPDRLDEKLQQRPQEQVPNVGGNGSSYNVLAWVRTVGVLFQDSVWIHHCLAGMHSHSSARSVTCEHLRQDRDDRIMKISLKCRTITTFPTAEVPHKMFVCILDRKKR